MEGFGPKDSLSEFTLAEIKDMEKIFKEIGEQSLGQAFFQDIATSFSCSASCAGKSAITWEQVQSWFQNRHEQLQDKVTPSSGALKLFDDLSDVPISSKAPESFLNPKGKKISDLSGLTYEAKSKKDNAWYDVASFLNYKFLSTGELAVRVRFAGFGNEEDEWVNVKRGVREQSIPLEHSECHKVMVGDLVLCFQEREDHAVYHDAYVVGIQKRQHDIRGCRCIFTVRYDHDNTEEKVDLGRICCRPKHYSQSALDIEVGPTQHYSQPTFDIQEGVRFPF
ncbi:protein SAWADEE HOMEODOMAIN HOMOLOG 1-like isoform X1 [Quercus robur]|uniref:protein SAWADEE HOMEODOMAIN HOMOLOG 1-like isoform X1 n=1 Tax=Quercus robur TaxID=38942 RepID=UPI002163274B|nr:protein SAWADEE HOMEODOMAIN HOMOLOG 1-like isoform X1 [Quercus robur]